MSYMHVPQKEESLAILRGILESEGEARTVLLMDSSVIPLLPCDEGPQPTIWMMNKMVDLGFPRPSWAMVASDSYHWKGTRRQDSPKDLEVEFKAGNPDVVECLLVCCITKEGPGSFSLMQKYTRINDTFIFDDPYDTSDDMNHVGGGMVDLLRQLVGAPRVVVEVPDAR